MKPNTGSVIFPATVSIVAYCIFRPALSSAPAYNPIKGLMLPVIPLISTFVILKQSVHTPLMTPPSFPNAASNIFIIKVLLSISGIPDSLFPPVQLCYFQSIRIIGLTGIKQNKKRTVFPVKTEKTSPCCLILLYHYVLFSVKNHPWCYLTKVS